MQILINLKMKWSGGQVITTSPDVNPPVAITPVPEVLPPTTEYVDFTERFYELVKNQSVTEIFLEEEKVYVVKKISKTTLLDRKLKIHSGLKRAILLFGIENYTPVIHGNVIESSLFEMSYDSELIIDNVNLCQPKQLTTVQVINPRIFESIQHANANWTVLIRNCDTTAMGNNGGFGLGLIYGGTKENHVALINFKHYGVGLMDAKNPYQNGILYITMRDVETYALEDAKLSQTDFQHTGSLKDNILTFDGSVYSLTSGYNWNWMDNDSYIVLFDRYTFFLDGYKSDTVVNDNQFKIRPQAKGLTKVGILNANTIYSNEVELHVGDKFEYNGNIYTITSKDRLQYEWFDSRTTHTIAVPERRRSIGYTVDKDILLPSNYHCFGRNWIVKRNGVAVRDDFDKVVDYYILLNRLTGTTISREEIFQKALNESFLVYDQITIDYKGQTIEFQNKPITLLYKGNGGFRTIATTVYREQAMLNSRGIGHLSYNHSDISMDARNVNHRGFYRGSEKGNGISLIWNLDNCQGFEDSGTWFKTAIPLTKLPNLDFHERIKRILNI